MKPVKPTLIVDRQKVIANIAKMMRKTESTGIRFRPHFKTHQSPQIGNYFKEQGVTSITVSSVEMAAIFARHGWDDITIAILVNPLEIDEINRLAGEIKLSLLVDSTGMVTFLKQSLQHNVDIWIKIDTGYHRTGLENHRLKDILALSESVTQAENLRFKGLLTHTGTSYGVQSVTELKKLYQKTVSTMNEIREYLKRNCIKDIELSIGDTPTCSVVEELYGVDEIRPGNFVYYDVMQLALGSCREDEIAAAAACPVIAKYPQRNEIVVYGGAVHLSKESIIDANDDKIFGLVALPEKDFRTWGPSVKNTFVKTLSQEHGIIKTEKDFLQKINAGDILFILPVHSCLTANLLKESTI
ncbi:MAG: alanine racemase [bacterium]|nr:alanine racemase [bacterium]